MNEASKSIIQRLLTSLSQASDAALSLMYVLAFSSFKIKRKIRKTNNHAIILGNGPSLAQDHQKIISLIEGGEIDVWSVNNFGLSKEYQIFRPNFYVLADPNYWISTPSEQVESSRNALFDALNKKTHWQLHLYLPVDALNSGALRKINNVNIDVAFFNRTPVTGTPGIRNFLFNKNLGMPPPYNVLIAAIYLSLSCNYRKILLFGADHSWHEEIAVDTNNNLLVSQKHFYDTDHSADPIYKKKDTPFTISSIFIRWGLVFSQYEVLNNYALSKKIDIFNLSSKSYIDAFRRFE